MFSRDLWSEIFYSIKSNKLRTFLTGFSVAWGIFILVLLLASVEGMKNGFAQRFNDDANNTIFIYASVTTKAYGGFEAGRRLQLDNDDLDYIKKTFKGFYEYITPRFNRTIVANYKRETGTYTVRSVNPDHQKTERTNLIEGRFLNKNDLKKSLKVLVLGKVVAEELFKEEDPVGKNIIIDNLSYKVIGVFSDDGNEREERFIYAPVTTFQRVYGNVNTIDQIVLTYNPDFNFAEAINFSDALEKILRRRLVVAPDDQGAIYLNNYAESFSDITNFTNMLTVISIAIGMLVLIAGIVGIGNILVFIIKERTKEIGIRKALGATPFSVIKLVLLESVFITSISGFIGMFLAIAIVNTIGPYIETDAFANPSVDLAIVVTSTIVLVVAGVCAGMIPAVKASRVKPIVALRAD